MPTYEFSCPNGHEFERFYRKISDGQAELPCPECGAMATRLVSGGAGLLFKGSGFYLTDYGKNAHAKKDGAKEPAGKESGAGETPSTEKAASGDAKPAAESKPAAAESAPAAKSAAKEPSAPKKSVKPDKKD